LKKTTLIVNCFICAFTAYLFAADKVDNDKQNELSGMQEQAREYRSEGLKLQELGDLENALKSYQKAIEADPTYPDAYNDLGIIYEAYDMPDRAEESYLQVIKIDPCFLGAYSNLALFYESKRDLANAAYYWKRRMELGDENDPWTFKAQQRIEDIQLSLSQDPGKQMRKSDIVDLMREVTNDKFSSRLSSQDLAAKKIKEAKINYGKKDYPKAITGALDAQYLDSSNKEAEDFVEKQIQAKARAR